MEASGRKPTPPPGEPTPPAGQPKPPADQPTPSAGQQAPAGKSKPPPAGKPQTLAAMIQDDELTVSKDGRALVFVRAQ